MAPSSLLEVVGLGIGYGGRAILPRIDLSLQSGQALAVIGPNGAGKSTFLKTLLGLQPPVSGHVTRDAATIGYVPQRSEVDPAVPQRVIDLVRMGAEQGGGVLRPWQLRRNPAIATALRDADVEPLARTPWRRLSEGQKQRALLAQALAGEPRLLVLDEPTSAMDQQAEAHIFATLQRLRSDRALGIIVIGHHLALLAQFATHLLLLDQDERMVLYGERGVVLAHPAFIERYGQPRARTGWHG